MQLQQFNREQLVTLSYEDQALQRTISLFMLNFKKVQQHFNKLEVHLDKRMTEFGKMFNCQSQQLKIKFKSVEGAIESTKKDIKQTNTHLHRLTLNLSENQSKVYELFNFKKSQAKLSEHHQQKLQSLKATANQFSNDILRIDENLQRKSQKSQIQRLRKQNLNSNELIKQASAKVQDLQYALQKLSISHRKLQEKKHSEKKIYEMMEQIMVSDKSKIISKKDSMEIPISQLNKRQKKQQFKVPQIDLIELNLKVNRLIEIEKTRDKQTWNQRKVQHKSHFNDVQLKILQDKLRIQQKNLQTIEARVQLNSKKLQVQRTMVEAAETLLRNICADQIQKRFKDSQLQILRQISKLALGIQTKITVQQFNQLSKQLQNKFLKLESSFNDKASKADVKKALVFLQSRLKEIAVLITEEETNASATKKFLTKCLSCDKDIQNVQIMKLGTQRQKTTTTSRRFLISQRATCRLKGQKSKVELDF